MTKEELKHEAEEYAEKSKPNFVVNEYGSTVFTQLDIEQAYLASAEPREKSIAELQAETFFLKDSLDHEVELHHHAEEYIKSLETQIEKMKSAIISERDEALRVEDIITYGVLNDVIDKWEIEEK